ncbi:hypothetical protein A2U01_0111388, partial [Trifolium medium]|nr:hypothetical protein [Trifolium medium]
MGCTDKGISTTEETPRVILPTPGADATSAAPSLWDPLFDPINFIERELSMVGDISRFADTPSS